MAGMNFTPPVPQLTAAQLAQLGLAAFRPPNPMSMPGMPSAPMGGQPQGMGIGEGMGMLSAGLGALKGLSSDPTNPGVPTPAGDPTGGAGPAFLGGNTPLGGVNDPASLANPLQKTGFPALWAFLTGGR